MAVLDNGAMPLACGGAMGGVITTARRTHGSSSLSGGPSIKKFRVAGRGGSKEPTVGGSTSCLTPSLKSELTALADRHAQSPPPEIFVLFPNWTTELPQILHSQSAAQLKVLLSALDAQAEHEPELTVAYAFASAALRGGSRWPKPTSRCAASPRTRPRAAT